MRWTALVCSLLTACGDDESGMPVDAARDGTPVEPDAPVDAMPDAMLPPLPVGVLVTSRGSGDVLEYDGTGASTRTFANDPDLVRPVGITFGPDGDVYVAVGDTERVMRFDADTGASLGLFGTGGMIRSPRNVNFGPDGAFYVADGFKNQVLRFDGTTGVLDRVFISDPALRGPTSFTFGPDGDVAVVSVLTNKVLRFDRTGALVGDLATEQLAQPHDVSYGPDRNLYVTNSGSTKIQRFDGTTGVFLDTFVDDPTLINPLGMAWGPDGNLYVANQGRDEVVHYDGITGAPLGAFVMSAAGGLDATAFLAFRPAATLALTRAGGSLVVAGARPGAAIGIVRGTAGGISTGTVTACPTLSVPLGGASLADTRVADESGYSVLAQPTGTSFAVVDASRCTVSDAFTP